MLGVHPVKADCTFGGPGITPGTKKCVAFPAIVEVETEGCYKFTYQGCEAKGGMWVLVAVVAAATITIMTTTIAIAGTTTTMMMMITTVMVLAPLSLKLPARMT